MKVYEMFNLKRLEGDVGIEIEMEGLTPFPQKVNDYWKYTTDGSLRGAYNGEYVMKSPVLLKDLRKAILSLKRDLLKYGSKPVYSERAGIHVHVNVQELDFNQVVNMACTYYCLEDVLIDYCGDNRVGNHFCLRLRDAEGPLFDMEQAIKHNDIYCLNSNIRYASLNFLSIFKYGSLEFRAMETQPDFSKIEEWARALVSIRDYAMHNSRKDIAMDISGFGPCMWAKKVLGEELFEAIVKPDSEDKIIESMRRIQTLIYR